MKHKANNILLAVGARPNFVKIAPICRAFKKTHCKGINVFLVHTGQHYDYQLSQIFFKDLNIPKPDIHLGVGSESHVMQLANIMVSFEKTLYRIKPDLVVVVGDVNSTLACALTAHKMNIDIAHVEAGLRSFDRTMPEESNRILTDHLSDILFTPSADASDNLLKEGIGKGRMHMVGNVMIDSLKNSLSLTEKRRIMGGLGLVCRGKVLPYSVVTLHRPGNVDDTKTFKDILTEMERMGRSSCILYPIHPRALKNIEKYGLEKHFKRIIKKKVTTLQGAGLYGLPPLGYLDFLCLERHAQCVITDSGGIQEETSYLGVPCLTLRPNTERPITVEKGTNTLVKNGPKDLYAKWHEQIKRKKQKDKHLMPKWDGKAAERIVDILVNKY